MRAAEGLRSSSTARFIFFVRKEGEPHNLTGDPEPRALRATRTVRNLRSGEEADLLIVNDRIIGRLDGLTTHADGVAATT
jgi:hypothetical protein